MRSKIIWRNFFLLTILCSSLQYSAYSQKNKKPRISKKQLTKNKISKPKIISLGVVNGRATNLVEPEYPKTASFLNVHGTVQVSIILDESGKVLEAKAIKGNVFLIPNSLQAALKSKFKPLKLNDGLEHQFSGVIYYIFEAKKLNWLELGYCSLEIDQLDKYLPYDFESEKQLIKQYQSSDVVYKMAIFKNLISSIENKLQTNNKNLWLFNVGNEIRNFERNFLYNNEIEQTALQNLLFEVPPKISIYLIERIEKIIELSKQKEPTKMKLEIENFIVNLYSLGN